MPKRDKYVRVFDPKTKILHVRPRGTPVPMSRSGVIQEHPKAADLDQVFAKPRCPRDPACRGCPDCEGVKGPVT